MLQAYLLLAPKPGRMDDLVAEYQRAGIIEAGLPYGLQRGEAVVVPGLGDQPDRLLITSTWADQDAYDSWLSAPERVTVTVGVWPLLTAGKADAVHKVERDTVDASEPLPLGPIIDPIPDGVERVIIIGS